MRVLRIIRNYLFYCGIEKDEYRELKKAAYASNFEVWRILHLLMTVVFAAMFACSFAVDIMAQNRIPYLVLFAYSLTASLLFLFVLKKDSIIAQLFIYLSISMLFFLGALISQNKPGTPSTTFIVLLLITPMFMIDKPYFMGIELISASVIFLIWMRGVKLPDVWKMDVSNVIIFTVVGIFLHIIANSIRIKEFVLAKKIRIQKDTDELTGLKNKGALTHEINEFLVNGSTNKGIMLLLDINRFKAVNDTYGHDVGDSVITQLGVFLNSAFTENAIVGRFGGDEFIVFIKDEDRTEEAKNAARRIIDGSAQNVVLPDKQRTISVNIGIAVYHGVEKNYSEIFKKADIALYKTKQDRSLQFEFYREAKDCHPS